MSVFMKRWGKKQKENYGWLITLPLGAAPVSNWLRNGGCWPRYNYTAFLLMKIFMIDFTLLKTSSFLVWLIVIIVFISNI